MMITLKGIQTEAIEVQVDRYTLLRTTAKFLRIEFKLNYDRYIRDDGFIYYDEDCGHGSPLVYKEIEATEEQKRAYEVIRFLERL